MGQKVTTAGLAPASARRPWQTPAVQRIGAEAAETGRLIGGEALVLLS